MKQNSFRLFLGLFAEAYIHPAPAVSDTISFTESIQTTCFADVSDVTEVVETFDTRYDLSEIIALEEQLDVRAKGGVKTLFITDERYFKAKNA